MVHLKPHDKLWVATEQVKRVTGNTKREWNVTDVHGNLLVPTRRACDQLSHGDAVVFQLKRRHGGDDVSSSAAITSCSDYILLGIAIIE